jgi:hypothetical protein
MEAAVDSGSWSAKEAAACWSRIKNSACLSARSQSTLSLKAEALSLFLTLSPSLSPFLRQKIKLYLGLVLCAHKF